MKNSPSTSSGRTGSVGEAIRAAAGRLAATSDTARLDAELLMAHALGVTRSDLLLRHLRAEPPACFAALVERRAAHEPVAHILGEQEFFGLTLRVTPDTLIPRGDSELLVEAALDLTGETGRALDLGTGTGALLLAFLAHRPGWSGVAIDASEAALAVARDNAGRLALADRAELLLADWSRPGWAERLGKFELVLCNPPYVETGAKLAPCVARFEPARALFAGSDGLDDYRVLLPVMDRLLAADGIAIFEIGHDQGEGFSGLAGEAGLSCEIRRDLADRPRAAICTRGVGKGERSV